MPHVTLEYSADGVNKESLIPFLRQAQDILVDTLPANLASFKSRAVPSSHYVVGAGEPDHGFYHLHVKVKAGRTRETLDKAAQEMMNLMKSQLSGQGPTSYSVEIQELADSYLTETV